MNDDKYHHRCRVNELRMSSESLARGILQYKEIDDLNDEWILRKLKQEALDLLELTKNSDL